MHSVYAEIKAVCWPSIFAHRFIVNRWRDLVVDAARTDKNGVELVLVRGETAKFVRNLIDFRKWQNRMQPSTGQGKRAGADRKINQPAEQRGVSYIKALVDCLPHCSPHLNPL